MSPTFYLFQKYRFYVNSREERRMHIHVQSPEGELKVWLEPAIEVAKSVGFRAAEVNEALTVIAEKKDEFIRLWKKHFNQ